MRSKLNHKDNCRTELDKEGLPGCDCGADAANVAIQREINLSVESDMMGYRPVDVKARIKAIEDRFHNSYIDDFTRKLVYRP